MLELPPWPIAGDRERELVNEVLDSAQWGGFHPLLSTFEHDFAHFQHCKHGILASNGTVTLELMLAAAGIRAGDEVIVPAISFVSTASAVSRVGATPVFVDIEPYSFNIDPEWVKQAVSPQTKAVMAVHFGGPLANMDRLSQICEEHSLLLFEDAAHAHGAEWSGRRAGSFGLASSFSFQNGKVMTAGEGGIVVTNDDDLAERMRSLANQGRRPGHSFFHHFELATNARMTALQAAVLMAQLERLDAQIDLRSRNAEAFLAEAQAPGLTLQRVPQEVNRNPWYLLLGRINAKQFGETRDEFHARLTAAGIPCTPFYPHVLYSNPMFAALPHRVLPCPNAEACLKDAFWISFRVLMGDEDLARSVARLVNPLRGA